MGKAILFRIASESEFSDRRAARVGETEDFSNFIKTFTDSVVAGCANNLELIVIGHIKNLSMTAGNNESKKGESWRLIGFEPVGVDVGFEMMNSIERFRPKDSEGAGGKSAN